MRLDVYLSTVCILKSRTMAKEACDRKKVSLNGTPGKGSSPVSAGDRIRLDLSTRILEIEVVEVPGKQVTRKAAPGYYQVLKDTTP